MHLLRFMLVMTAVSATSVTAQVRRSIQAVGTASVSAQPDRIKVDIGVTTMANTAQEASNENATTMSAVQNQIRQVLGPGADIQTIGYSITPNYKYTQGAPPVLIGYTATHTVEVTTGDKDSIVKVIDSVGQSGATSITGLRFAISNDEPLREQALAAASKQALSHAQAIAKGLGVQIGGVINAQEGSSVTPLVADAAAGAAPATPIEPGLVRVSATVTVQVEVIQ